MASSVASERAFSAAGITISKRRNRLDADIVEALQCLKSLIPQQDLISKTFPSLAEEEFAMDDADAQRANQGGTSEDVIDDEAEWEFEAIADTDLVDNDADNDDDEN